MSEKLAPDAADAEDLFGQSTWLSDTPAESGDTAAAAPASSASLGNDVDAPTVLSVNLAATAKTAGAAPQHGAAAERYSAREPLGRGGMGEVLLCRDRIIGRDVAMKLIRPRSGEVGRGLQQRFVREARVQGQLEHPAIVPVYDAGVNGDGALYFTMKRVRGVTLAHVLRGLRAGDGELVARYSRRRLLTLFSNVCMAVHFAHDKGVVHRDLKPANIMLGDFGEVYVLDWGLAALHARAADVPPGERASLDEEPAPAVAGGTMGTPGYMAPEQISNPALAGVAADIYALGAILFEILTHERMHAAESVADVLRSTLETDGASPAARAAGQQIPPELDRLCRDATCLLPAERTRRVANAQALSRAVESFLDGERDLTLRRELANAHAAAAEEARARALAAGAGADVEHGERARAMREVTAALGLDAEHEGARQTLIRLLAEPPRAIPAQAEAELAATSRATYSVTWRTALLHFVCHLLYLPIFLWLGVRDWGLFALGWCTLTATAIAASTYLRRPPARASAPLLHLGIMTFTLAASSVMFGAYVVVPMLALGMCVTITASVGHWRGLVPIASCLGVVVPAVLGWAGVIPSGYRFADGQWVVLPRVFNISPAGTQLLLLMGTVTTLLTTFFFVARLRSAYNEAARRLWLQAWQIRQILPGRHDG